MKQGAINQSRSTSDFVKRLSPKDREVYIKCFIVSCYPEQFIPLIEIINYENKYREAGYTIHNGAKKGVKKHPRKEANFIGFMNLEEREPYVKRSIVTGNIEYFTQFVKITKHDRHYREVGYVIDVPEPTIQNGNL